VSYRVLDADAAGQEQLQCTIRYLLGMFSAGLLAGRGALGVLLCTCWVCIHAGA
jgi:hypothetical protein